MESIIERMVSSEKKVTRLTKFWVFALEHRNEYEKKIGRPLNPVELKEWASIPWEQLDSKEKHLYHLKAKAINRAAKQRGARFINNKKKKRRFHHSEFNECDIDETFYCEIDDDQCSLDDFSE